MVSYVHCLRRHRSVVTACGPEFTNTRQNLELGVSRSAAVAGMCVAGVRVRTGGDGALVLSWVLWETREREVKERQDWDE